MVIVRALENKTTKKATTIIEKKSSVGVSNSLHSQGGEGGGGSALKTMWSEVFGDGNSLIGRGAQQQKQKDT